MWYYVMLLIKSKDKIIFKLDHLTNWWLNAKDTVVCNSSPPIVTPFPILLGPSQRKKGSSKIKILQLVIVKTLAFL